MKLEEQKIIRIDGANVLSIWTDIETLEERYEVRGQTSVNVQTQQGVVPAPVQFMFMIEAKNLAEAAEQLPVRLQEETDKAVRQFIETINAQQRKIQVAGGDQVIQFRKDAPRRNGCP